MSCITYIYIGYTTQSFVLKKETTTKSIQINNVCYMQDWIWCTYFLNS